MKKYIKRILQIDLSRGGSAFLWGPRKTGKTTLLKQRFPDAFWVDLLDYDLYLQVSKRPTRLREMLGAQNNKIVVIDEVQKVPRLIDEVHWLIENKDYQFVLSGSSARKLKREGGNLLGGRASRYELYPFVTREISDLDLDSALTNGLVPSHYLNGREKERWGYIQDYLKEEVQAEALTRNLPAFSRFLEITAITNGMLLNYSNAARECGVSVKTVREYYQILEDTLLGHRLLPWTKSKKRRLIETCKFYLFDVGIVSSILKYRTLYPGTPEYGRAFEHFIIQECWAYRHYSGKEFPMSFWRTASGSEVDLILGNPEVAIEISSSTSARGKTKGLHLLRQELKPQQNLVVSRDPVARRLESGILILPWKDFCERLWAGEII